MSTADLIKKKKNLVRLNTGTLRSSSQKRTKEKNFKQQKKSIQITEYHKGKQSM